MRKLRQRGGCIYIGTSGWVYPHWRGVVYPADLPESQWLGFYTARLRSVELNSTFYRLPRPETLHTWRDSVPDGFVFAFKVSGYVTHRRKLRDPGKTLPPILTAASVLSDRLGPALFQLPPRWRVNVDRLELLLDVLPQGLRCAFEFRDPSWLCESVYTLLRRHGAALCRYELAGYAAPDVLTADFTYIRLHGPVESYRGCYTEAALQYWAGEIERHHAEGCDVYCYFDNDEAGHAFANAQRLQALTAD